MRIVREIYHQCREQVGEDYPLLIKMSAYDNMKKGLKRDEGVVMAEMMADMGFDGLEVSCGIAEDGFSTIRGDMQTETILTTFPMYKNKNMFFKWVMRNFGEKILNPMPFTEAYNLESAKEIKSKVNVPVFLVGGLIDPAVMESILEKREADYISLSRALIFDPNFPQKMKEGKKEPSKCLHCNLCITCVVTEPLRCHHGRWTKADHV